MFWCCRAGWPPVAATAAWALRSAPASLLTLLNMVAAGYGTMLIPALAAGPAQDAGIVLRPLGTRARHTVRITSGFG